MVDIEPKVSITIYYMLQEAVAWRRSVKKMLLESSSNSQENTCTGVSFIMKLLAEGRQPYEKTDSGTEVFLWIL